MKNKKWSLIVIYSLLIISLSSIYTAFFFKNQANFTQNKQINQYRSELTSLHNNIKGLRQSSLMRGDFYRTDSCLEDSSILDKFSASDKNEMISMDYIGGYGSSGSRITLCGDGTIKSINQDGSEHVSSISSDQSNAFFRKFITSGVLTYSQPVVDLKMALLTPSGLRVVTDLDNAEFTIHIPKYNIERTIVIYAPTLQYQNYPDIFELKMASTLENDFLALRPKNKN